MTRCLALLALIGVIAAAPAAAQTTRDAAPNTREAVQNVKDARVQVTVVDPTNAVLPNAVVTITGLDDATKATAIKPVTATDKGVAQFDGVVPGRYMIEAEFPGFEKGALKDVRFKTGDNKHVVVLSLQKLNQSVTVADDKQSAASSRTDTFGTAMTREQIEALSDDPDEMQKQLQALAGPDGVIRVDGFEGQPLPNKAQIKSVHITRDAFAAENHGAGALFLDIVTAPGVGALRGSARAGFYDSGLDGKNPFVPTKGPQQSKSYGGSVGGTIIKDKSDFSVSFSGSNSYNTPIQVISTPDGRVSKNLDVRQPYDYASLSGIFTYALTKDQTLKITGGRYSTSSENQGIGSYDEIERAYSSNSASTNIRLQEVGPLGRRFFTNTRVAIIRNTSASHSVTDAPTIVVQDAFTSGGAQRRGGTTSTTYSIASDLDYVRGKHSFRTGVQIDGTDYHTDAESNYLGTYTFADLASYQAGTPLSFTRRIGDPNITYTNTQVGVYVQDDYRFRKSLTFSAGLRYEAQTHVSDYNDVQPRAGLTWAPFKSGHTTLRASWGLFYDWLPAGTYGQTVLVDGFHQQEVNLPNPSYPNAGSLGAAPPTNKYLLGSGIRLPRSNRVSLGISQTIAKNIGVGVSFADTLGSDQFVGENLNAPIDGVRPDAQFANIIEAVSAASSRSKSVSMYANYTVPPGAPANTAKWFDWRRSLYFYANYGYGRSENNTDGAFSVPATGNLDLEWGPSSYDVRHRAYISINTGAFKNLGVSLYANWNSAPPITIRTGLDDNGDLIFNDRPEGVGRNTERTASQYYGSLYLSYSIGIGQRKVALPPGISITSTGGALSIGTVAQQPTPRYRLILSASIDNPTNHQNYTGYSGIIRSPFFLQPTAVQGVRRVTFSASLSF